MNNKTYSDAIREALWEEMERDENVYLIGEDIGLGGGAFYITKGFHEKFGDLRVVDTPLSEAGFTGSAIGSSLAGLRPVVEFQFADFVTESFKMIVDFAAGNFFRKMGEVPIVFRLPAGALTSAGPFHSQNPEIWFFGTPGIKIVAPSNSYDAKGLMKSAIRDNNPVIFIEYKKFYNYPTSELPVPLRIEIPEEDYEVPIGKARILLEGKDISLITFGTTVLQALKAAEQISEEGVSVEVIDLRTIIPFDKETIIDSVKKTGKILFVHEARKQGGISGELSSLITEEAFEYLDAPPIRIGAINTPVPLSPPLEKAYLPNTEEILIALRDLLEY